MDILYSDATHTNLTMNISFGHRFAWFRASIDKRMSGRQTTGQNIITSSGRVLQQLCVDVLSWQLNIANNGSTNETILHRHLIGVEIDDGFQTAQICAPYVDACLHLTP